MVFILLNVFLKRNYYKIEPLLVDMIELVYDNTKGRIRFEGETSDEFSLETRVKQGCVMSPTLFAVFLDYILRESLIHIRPHGIKWVYTTSFYEHLPNAYSRTLQKIITLLLFADDMVLLSTSAAGLQESLDILDTALANCGLKLCPDKSKVMLIGYDTDRFPPLHIKLQGKEIEQVTTFKYLGTWLSADGEETYNIERRVKQAVGSFFSWTDIWNMRDLNAKIKGRFFTVSIVSSMLHGIEHWRLKEHDIKTLEKCHMDIIKMILQRGRHIWQVDLNYTAMRDRLGVPSLRALIVRRRLRWFGHLLRDHWREPSVPSIAMCGRLHLIGHLRSWNDTNSILIRQHFKEIESFLSQTEREKRDTMANDRVFWLNDICQRPIVREENAP